MKEGRDIEGKKRRNKCRTACFMLLLRGVYSLKRALLAGKVRFSESIVGNYQHT